MLINDNNELSVPLRSFLNIGSNYVTNKKLKNVDLRHIQKQI
jgi:hypothetical protein